MRKPKKDSVESASPKARAQPAATSVEAFARELSVVVPQLFAANVQFSRQNDLGMNQTFEECLGAPCSIAEIDELEQYLGRPLPPSYRAFLTLYRHWIGFSAGHILGPAEHRDKKMQARLSWKADLFREFEPVNPIADGALPLALEDGRNMVLLEMPVRADGEMDVVEYYLTEEAERQPDLVAYLKSQLEKTLGYLKPKKTIAKKAPVKAKKPKEKKVKEKAETQRARNPVEESLFALDRGDGPAILAALERVKDVGNALRLLGVRADNSRVDVKVGAAVLDISDFLFARDKEEITRFLPTMAIAAVHQHQQPDATRRARAESVLMRLRPLVAAVPSAAELIGAWASGLQEKRAFQEAIELFEVAIACPKMSERSFYSGALFVILKDYNQLPIDEPRARRFLAVCLPHADKEPAIFHYAACVLAELGDVAGVIEQLERASRAGYRELERMKSNCAALWPALQEQPKFQALTAPK